MKKVYSVEEYIESNPNFTLNKSHKIGIKYCGIIYSSAEFTLAEFS
jgi:hypothetical protein